MPVPNNRGNKRSRNEATQAEQVYYDRLIHQCRKDLSKQIKVCKSFECQKLIRKIKSDDSVSLQQKYETLKQLEIEPIVYECCRRLGILQLNPSGEKIEKMDVPDMLLTEKLLKHKRLQESLESWGDQITQFRQWCLKREDRLEVGNSTDKQSKSKETTENELDRVDASSSLFVHLGGKTDNNAKKNRPGQRARKAKAAAIQAKQKGLPRPEKSLNWRNPKPKAFDGESNEVTLSDTTRNHVPENREPHQEVKLPAGEGLHPSWQAQKAKKEGIVAFQGKKITFD